MLLPEHTTKILNKLSEDTMAIDFIIDLVPDYVADPIDLVEDGVRMTLEKLTFQATKGKHIEGIWEAPMPAAVNPLSDYEVSSFRKDSRLMSVEFLPTAGTRKYRTKKKISALKNYRPHVSPDLFMDTNQNLLRLESSKRRNQLVHYQRL